MANDNNVAPFIGGVIAGAVLADALESDEKARLRFEREQKEKEQQRARQKQNQEQAAKLHHDLWGDTKPKYGTLRYEVHNTPDDLPVDPLNRVLLFSQQHTTGYNGFSTPQGITKSAQAFFQRIKDCKSEQEARHCILRFKEELETLIKNSDIPDAFKYKFHCALNPESNKGALRGFTIVIGILLAAAVTTPTAGAAAAAAAPLGGEAVLAALFGPWILSELFISEKRSFPTEYGAIADPHAFRALVAELNTLVTQTERSIQGRPSFR